MFSDEGTFALFILTTFATLNTVGLLVEVEESKRKVQ